jgi:hypothetical protein
VVPPNLDMLFNKNPCREDDKGLKASLTLRYAGYPVISFALITVAVPARTIHLTIFHPAAQRTIQRGGSGSFHTVYLLSGTAVQRLLFLFTAFFDSIVSEFIAGFQVHVKNNIS